MLTRDSTPEPSNTSGMSYTSFDIKFDLVDNLNKQSNTQSRYRDIFVTMTYCILGLIPK